MKSVGLDKKVLFTRVLESDYGTFEQNVFLVI